MAPSCRPTSNPIGGPSCDTDVAVIGAGPIGIELAARLRRDAVDFIHLEAGCIGATVAWWAPGTRFFSSPERIAIAGVPLITPNQDKATREQYLAYLRGVVQAHSLTIRTFTRLARAERHDAGFALSCDGKSIGRCELRARRLVLAIGDMHAPRSLGIPGENLAHVSHYFADPHTYAGRRVLIVGGKNSAVEAAIRCRRVGARVTISYRRPEFDQSRIKYWLYPELASLTRKGDITFLPETTPSRINPDSAMLLGPNGQQTRVEADDVLLLTGYQQDKALFTQLEVDLHGEGQAPCIDRRTMRVRTSGKDTRPPIYVAGTASAGTQLGGVRVFIENSHSHVERIASDIVGSRCPDCFLDDDRQPEELER